jgi:hypothetical protein
MRHWPVRTLKKCGNHLNVSLWFALCREPHASAMIEPQGALSFFTANDIELNAEKRVAVEGYLGYSFLLILSLSFLEK